MQKPSVAAFPAAEGFQINGEFRLRPSNRIRGGIGTMPDKEAIYNERFKRVNDAISLKEPDRMPLIPKISGMPFHLYEDSGSHKSTFYDYEEATQTYLRYHKEFEPDVGIPPATLSGKANEIALPTMIDWPGRPGTSVENHCTYQALENEYLEPEEYPELIRDYTGFMFKKYIPRAFEGLSGFSSLGVNPANMLGTKTFAPMLNSGMKKAMQNFIEIIDESEKATLAEQRAVALLKDAGFPVYNTGGGEVPFDIISDYFRGTLGMFEDMIDQPEMIERACEIFVDIQIASWEYLKNPDMAIKRVFFPMHKGMDGFMSPEQYENLYWKPYQKLLAHLISIGATPIIYCEGPYNTRMDFIREQLLQLPTGKCIIHFEEGDFAEIKKKFSGIACVSGGMPIYLLEYGTREQVVDRVKYLVDNCAAGGGYLFNSSGSIEHVKRENVEAMFETARNYGRK